MMVKILHQKHHFYFQSIGRNGDGQQTGSRSRVDGNGVAACGSSVASAQRVMALGEALAAALLQLLSVASDGIRRSNGGALPTTFIIENNNHNLVVMCDRDRKLSRNNDAGSTTTVLHCVVDALQQVLQAASDDGRRSTDGTLLATLIKSKTAISF